MHAKATRECLWAGWDVEASTMHTTADCWASVLTSIPLLSPSIPWPYTSQRKRQHFSSFLGLCFLGDQG